MDMGAMALRMVASLAVVVGLLILAARIAGRRYRPRAGSTVTLLHRQQLSRGTGVSVISVGSRVLVLGTTEQQVRLLAELDPADVAPAVDAAPVVASHPVVETPPVVASRPAVELAETPHLDRLDDRARLDARQTTPQLGKRARLDVIDDRPVVAVSGKHAAPAGVVEAPAATPVPDPAAPTWFDDFLRERVDLVEAREAAGVSELPSAAAVRPRLADLPLSGPYADFAAALLAELGPADDVTIAGAPTPAPSGRRSRADRRAERRAAGAAPAPTPAPLAPTAPQTNGPLAGSVLSPQTWRQALGAVTRRAS
ncbi:flagellar biosynthetic protein FliO [Nocardioides sp. R-C-SC26]|uniref:flagellar biosynthetic protein FliO n=1 Tax=Nocardioides sp. R-C-SC26 TaxID=2870414 RepID=UPI001E4EB213|nr:flagellar biosynthetic protein FliO [Nocardioides sp. R-C-SC26]